ncbi:MAG: hypothetical protein HYZ79_00760 [Candidatus Melainabacteria bacterium]|nr:hypothetical protein [Candidatus Melainabacteria bacterium]
MKVVFYGGRSAGVISLLTLMALGHKVVCVIPVDEPVESVAKSHNLNIQKPGDINNDKFVNYMETIMADLVVCCHGRQIIKSKLLNLFKAINLHPCLYKYKGAKPINRLLADKNTKASVAAHWMIKEVDEGKVIVENFQKVKSDTVIGVYNEIYFLYNKSLVGALKKIYGNI